MLEPTVKVLTGALDDAFPNSTVETRPVYIIAGEPFKASFRTSNELKISQYRPFFMRAGLFNIVSAYI